MHPRMGGAKCCAFEKTVEQATEPQFEVRGMVDCSLLYVPVDSPVELLLTCYEGCGLQSVWSSFFLYLCMCIFS